MLKHRSSVSWVLALAALLFSVESWASCLDPFAEPEQVIELHLRTTTEAWQQMQASGLSEFGCDGQYPYFEGQFSCTEGDAQPSEQEWIDIGFRRRRDRSQTLQKLPLKLDFNRFVQGQRWPVARGDLGYRKLSLNSGQPDDAGGRSNGPESAPGVLSALLTEYLAWRMMKEELPESSGVAFAKLTLHFTDTDEARYQGLYLLIEDIDRTAIKARYATGEGTLFKTTDLACKDEPVFDDEQTNSATAGFTDWLQSDPNDFSGEWFERTNESIQLDGLLRQEALRELFANTADTPLGALNNYFAVDLYGARRVYLPWDLDDMFRPQPQIRDVDTPLQSSCVLEGGGQNNECSPIPLGVNIRDNSEIRARYLEILCRLTNGVAQETQLVERLNALDERVRPILAEEVPLLWAPEGLDPLDADTPGTYAAEVIRMRGWVVGRVQAVRQLIEDEGGTCRAGCEEGARVACDYWGCPSERTCVDGLWGACAPGAGHVPGSLDIDCDGVPEFLPVSAAEGEEPATPTSSVDSMSERQPQVEGASGAGLPTDAGAQTSAEAVTPMVTSTNSDTGCSCRLPASPSRSGTAWVWALVAAVILRRRAAQ